MSGKRSAPFAGHQGGERFWTILIAHLARLITERHHRSFRIGIDGIDASGKTTLANELAEALQTRGFTVLRASIDGFHRPRSERRRRESIDPGASYYEDSFDYDELRAQLLNPLGPHGDHIVRTRIFDFETDQPADEPRQLTQPGTILVFDGIFLLRPEIGECWDLHVFLKIDPETAIARAIERDGQLFGDADAVVERYRRRYLPGQVIYLNSVSPEARADVLIDNSTPANPKILRSI